MDPWGADQSPQWTVLSQVHGPRWSLPLLQSPSEMLPHRIGVSVPESQSESCTKSRQWWISGVKKAQIQPRSQLRTSLRNPPQVEEYPSPKTNNDHSTVLASSVINGNPGMKTSGFDLTQGLQGQRYPVMSNCPEKYPQISLCSRKDLGKLSGFCMNPETLQRQCAHKHPQSFCDKQALGSLV